MYSTSFVTIQPTSFCNIDCRYCYLPNRHERRFISLKTVAAIRENLVASQLLKENLLVSWHSGEPLVLPPSFYEAAFPLFSPKYLQGVNISQSLQTNGILITDTYCKLFKQFDIHIGISIDGPEHLHNLHRVNRRNLGTWHQVMAGLQKLQTHNVRHSIITVLTADSLDHAEDLYSFYIDNRIYSVGFNIDELEGDHDVTSYSDPHAEKKYQSFFRQFYKLCQQDKLLTVREFSFVEQIAILDGELPFNNQVEPLSTINVDTQGNFSTYSPELLDAKHKQYGDFILGNVHQGLISDCIESNKFKHLGKEIDQGVQACAQECAYFSICKGGAPSNKFFENESLSSTQTVYCYFRTKLLTELLLDEMSSLTN